MLRIPQRRKLMSDIAVFYLARLKEGFPAFDAFAQSLRKHPAGLDHDLIVICKGFKRRSEFAVVSAIFKGIPHQITTVDDDIGQDIHSYKAAAERFSHTYACFINTFTELKSADWLKKLFEALSLPRVGIVGATASFESLNNSWELLTKVQWLVTQPAAYNSELNKAFNWLIQLSDPQTAATMRSPYKRLRRAVGDIWHRRQNIQSILHHHQSVWLALSSRGQSFQFAHDYPRFPNPHIRSNVFMLRRDDLVKMPLQTGGIQSSLGALSRVAQMACLRAF
jgi:hypothetical protein